MVQFLRSGTLRLSGWRLARMHVERQQLALMRNPALL